VATRGSSRDTGSQRIGSPIKAKAVVLSIYIAMYLAVWLILRAMTSPDAAAAITTDISTVRSAAATLSTSQADVSEASSEPADSADGCPPNTATDSKSVSD
jgi:hypothetical protein